MGARGRRCPTGRNDHARAARPGRRRPRDSQVSRGAVSGFDRLPLLRDAQSRLGDLVVGRRRLRRSFRAGRRDRQPTDDRRSRGVRADGSDRAEVAFLVADAWQGRGISTILLAHLAAVAAAHGISTFVAEVLPDNHRMIEVFRESGFPVELRSVPGAIEIELPTSLSAEAVERFEERERIAAVAAVRSFLEPRSVAVIGASRRRGNDRRRDPAQPGRRRVHRLRVRGQRARPTSSSRCPPTDRWPTFPSRVDLAVVAVPAGRVVGRRARVCGAPGCARCS